MGFFKKPSIIYHYLWLIAVFFLFFINYQLLQTSFYGNSEAKGDSQARYAPGGILYPLLKESTWRGNQQTKLIEPTKKGPVGFIFKVKYKILSHHSPWHCCIFCTGDKYYKAYFFDYTGENLKYGRKIRPIVIKEVV